jgi:hypothetical protein
MIEISHLYIIILLVVTIFILVYILLRNDKIYEHYGVYSSHTCDNIESVPDSEELYDKVKDIDIVYMWIDREAPGFKSTITSGVNSRNRSNNEIIYSLRSVVKNMPWHDGRIFIVSPNQAPKNMKTVFGTKDGKFDETAINNAPKDHVIIIDQVALLPPEVGETENSFIMEFFLHKIPTLSENFIYMNDDYFIGKKTQPSNFFKLNDDHTLRPIFYNNTNIIDGGLQQSDEYEKSHSRIWYSATYFTNHLLTDVCGKNTRYYMEHAPYMFNKTWCREVYSKWESDIVKTFAHKKRHWKDIIFVLLYRYYCYETKKPSEMIQDTHNIFLHIVNNNANGNKNFYKKVESKCPIFFTLNDEYSSKSVQQDMTDFLVQFFNNKSMYEM